MVRIEIKKTVKGQMILAMEAEHEKPEEVLMCAARCFVGTARKLCGPISASQEFADEAARLMPMATGPSVRSAQYIRTLCHKLLSLSTS